MRNLWSLAEGSLYKVTLNTQLIHRYSIVCQHCHKLLSVCQIESFYSLSSTMNPYENALAQVVDHMLSERKCCVMNSQVRDKLAMMLRMRKSG